MAAPKAMLYVAASPGPKVPLSEFTTWYDTDHCPLRRSCAGFLNAARYEALDDKKPEWLATYELSDVSVMTSDAYMAQWKAQTDYEKNLLASCETIDRRVYRLTYDKRHPDYDDEKYDQRIYQAVALAPGPDLGMDDFHAWYYEEHIPMLSKVPGWLRSSRWELEPDQLRPGGVKDKDGKPVSPFLAVHEWTSTDVFKLPEHKAATQTPWRDRIMAGIDKEVEDRRLYKVHKLWK